VTIKPFRYFLFACVAFGCASFAQADIIVTPTFNSSNQALSDVPPDTTDYERPFNDGANAITPLTIGTFDFTIPTGGTVGGATVSGTFGDENYSASALVDLYVDGIEVAQCDSLSSPCFTGTVDGSLVAWSYTFSPTQLTELSSDFAAGSLDFTAIQKSFGSVVVGSPTLDLQVVPEPSSLYTLAGGLLAFIAWRRRK
jgi:PEP-CTERM motif